MNFSTYGPFVLEELASPGPEKLFDAIQAARPDLQLQYGIGVYIFASRNAVGHLIPWYVGKTKNEFGKRLIQHIRSGKFEELISEVGQLSLFLIAHVTNSGKIRKATQRTKDSAGIKAINQLEFALIGSCLSMNPNLLNK